MGQRVEVRRLPDLMGMMGRLTGPLDQETHNQAK